jgi:DNA-binding ferritin-like protein
MEKFSVTLDKQLTELTNSIANAINGLRETVVTEIKTIQNAQKVIIATTTEISDIAEVLENFGTNIEDIVDTADNMIKIADDVVDALTDSEINDVDTNDFPIVDLEEVDFDSEED